MKTPWGRYEIVDSGILPDGDEYWMKELVIMPGEWLSLQSHFFRIEVWKVQEGVAQCILGELQGELNLGEIIVIPSGVKHRAINESSEILIIREFAFGKLCREEDIVRYKDKYGRQNVS